MDMSNFTNITSLQSIASVVNNSTDGMLFIAGMFVFWIIILIVLINRNQLPFENNLVIASWSMFIISIFFWYAHLTPIIVPIFFLFISAFGILYLYSSSK